MKKMQISAMEDEGGIRFVLKSTFSELETIGLIKMISDQKVHDEFISKGNFITKKSDVKKQ